VRTARRGGGARPPDPPPIFGDGAAVLVSAAHLEVHAGRGGRLSDVVVAPAFQHAARRDVGPPGDGARVEISGGERLLVDIKKYPSGSFAEANTNYFLDDRAGD